MMKVSDYIVSLLKEKGVTDVFGYPGVGCGHFMESLSKTDIISHMVYHEQAAAFAACSYAQAAHKIGIVYTTAGPGATNLVSGIANAYADSIPVLFIVGDKDLATQRGDYQVRQLTSQEVDITSVAVPITKMSEQIKRKEDVRYLLEKAFHVCTSGRPGAVLLDIPSDIQRAEIDPAQMRPYLPQEDPACAEAINVIFEKLNQSEKPVILIGNGVKQFAWEQSILQLSKAKNIPIVTTFMASDLLVDEANKIGFIGMNGRLAANEAVRQCDVLLTLGARLNFKQVNNNRQTYAPNATILRVDCDAAELEVELPNAIELLCDLNLLIPELMRRQGEIKAFDSAWLQTCIAVKNKAEDQRSGKFPVMGRFMAALSTAIPDGCNITIDTGDNRVCFMDHFRFKPHQRFFQSSGLATMGYSLPAAVGAHLANHDPVVCINGDGGIMMNIQELQTIASNRYPITVVVFNNHCLGAIMTFQNRIFNGHCYTTTEDSGYIAADFSRIAYGFGFTYRHIMREDELASIDYTAGPQFIEITLPVEMG